MRRLMILLSLILIVIISGCGGQQTIQTGAVNDGIIIKDFSFDQSEIYDGDYVKLNIEVQNVGEVIGKLAGISVYGGWLTGSYLIPNSNNLKLDKAVPSENIEGESRYFSWTDTPNLGIQSSTNYQFGVRVKYNYTTEYVGTVRFVSPEHLDSLSKQQKDSLIVNNGIISSSVSNGPLNINPISGRSFIVGSLSSVSIKFGIKNVGSGYPENYLVNIEPPIGSVSSCYKSEEAKTNTTIKLSRGETGTFICDFPVSSGLSNYVDKTFKIIFDYSYYTDGSTSITVNPSGIGSSITTTTIYGCVAAGYSCTTDETECDNWCSQQYGANGRCISEDCPPLNNCCCECYGMI